MISKIGYKISLLVIMLVISTVVEAAGQTGLKPLKRPRKLSLNTTEPHNLNIRYRKNGKVDWWEMNQTPSTRFRVEQLVVPVSLVGIGAMGLGENGPLKGVNQAIKRGMYDLSKGVKLSFDDYVQYVPVALYLTLDFVGVEAKHSFSERLAVAVVTYIAVAGLGNGVKYTVREPRPYTGTRNSFPSGHTMTTFAGAELVRSEYGWAAGLGAYAMAGTVGFMRLYNGRHWFGDILAGAGLGILSARIGYWMLPLNRHIFRIPRKGQAMMATPIYYANNRAFGLSCAIQF